MPLNEIAASLYPWDLHDEGIEHILDVLTTRAEVNSVYLVGLMHSEKRPLHARHYPHNPVRKSYIPEDSRAYWKPEMSRYKRIKPMVSQRDFLAGRDWLQELVEAGRKRGLRTGCEISHTILDTEYAQAHLTDVLQRDVFGNIVGAFESQRGRTALPCLNSPDVQDYLIALFSDLAFNYDIDFVQTCLVLFGPGYTSSSDGLPLDAWQRLAGVAMGGCFCDACKAKAEAEGLDWSAMVGEAAHLARIAGRISHEQEHERMLLDESNYSPAELLVEYEAFAAWLHFRKRSVTEIFAKVHAAIKQAPRPVEFRYNTYLMAPERCGLDFKSAFAHVDSVRESDYSDQWGTLEGVAMKRSRLMKCRRAMRDDQPLLAALGVRPNATVETLTLSIKAAVEAGCDGLSLGHYDGATMERLDAVKQGLHRWEGRESDWQPIWAV
jgi:hypothetical protein